MTVYPFCVLGYLGAVPALPGPPSVAMCLIWRSPPPHAALTPHHIPSGSPGSHLFPFQARLTLYRLFKSCACPAQGIYLRPWASRLAVVLAGKFR